MIKVDSNRLGIAGELRVMSELLLRGHNPAKSYLEDGSDLILLDNGFKIEVKSAHWQRNKYTRARDNPQNLNRHGLHKGGSIYTKEYINFSLRGGHRKDRQNLNSCDFVICWTVDSDDFYVIPVKEVGKATRICMSSDYSNKWLKFRNNWEPLNRR